MLPIVSIIIPVYNVTAYIESCIESICQQTFRQFEVILVDDCGSDDSIAKAKNVLEHDGISYILLRHSHNRGLSAARNTGLEKARGEYVLFVDSDDMLTPRSLELLVSQADKTCSDMTYGNFETYGEYERVHCQTNTPYVMAWNKLCRRSFLISNHIQFVEGLLHEDCPWSFEVECKAHLISWVPEITYRYLIRQSGLQNAGEFGRHYQAYCKILQLYAKIIKECPSHSRLSKEQLVQWFEIQKALYFEKSKEYLTMDQLRGMYHLIRTLNPKPPISKKDCHYWVPEWMGFAMYLRFYKYHFC